MTFVVTLLKISIFIQKYFRFVSYSFRFRSYICCCLIRQFDHLFRTAKRFILSSVLFEKQYVEYSSYLQIYHVKIITYHINRIWKLKTTVNCNIAYVSLLRQLETVAHYFECISLSFFFFFYAFMINYIRYQSTILLKSDNLKIESFYFLLVAVSI